MSLFALQDYLLLKMFLNQLIVVYEPSAVQCKKQTYWLNKGLVYTFI